MDELTSFDLTQQWAGGRNSRRPSEGCLPCSCLHFTKNALTGKLPMSFGDASTGRLSFFSAFGNDLIGPVPAFHLKEGCVDDMSFSIEVVDKSSYGIIALRCQSLYDVNETKGLRELADLNKYKLKPYQRQRVLEMCPNFFNRGNCSTASWRGPVLLLQSNRLSCALPASITSKAENLRSLTLMGNKLGNGKMELPPWVHDSEKQPFFVCLQLLVEKPSLVGY